MSQKALKIQKEAVMPVDGKSDIGPLGRGDAGQTEPVKKQSTVWRGKWFEARKGEKITPFIKGIFLSKKAKEKAKLDEIRGRIQELKIDLLTKGKLETKGGTLKSQQDIYREVVRLKLACDKLGNLDKSNEAEGDFLKKEIDNIHDKFQSPLNVEVQELKNLLVKVKTEDDIIKLKEKIARVRKSLPTYKYSKEGVDVYKYSKDGIDVEVKLGDLVQQFNRIEHALPLKEKEIKASLKRTRAAGMTRAERQVELRHEKSEKLAELAGSIYTVLEQASKYSTEIQNNIDDYMSEAKELSRDTGPVSKKPTEAVKDLCAVLVAYDLAKWTDENQNAVIIKKPLVVISDDVVDGELVQKQEDVSIELIKSYEEMIRIHREAIAIDKEIYSAKTTENIPKSTPEKAPQQRRMSLDERLELVHNETIESLRNIAQGMRDVAAHKALTREERAAAPEEGAVAPNAARPEGGAAAPDARAEERAAAPDDGGEPIPPDGGEEILPDGGEGKIPVAQEVSSQQPEALNERGQAIVDLRGQLLSFLGSVQKQIPDDTKLQALYAKIQTLEDKSTNEDVVSVMKHVREELVDQKIATLGEKKKLKFENVDLKNKWDQVRSLRQLITPDVVKPQSAAAKPVEAKPAKSKAAAPPEAAQVAEPHLKSQEQYQLDEKFYALTNKAIPRYNKNNPNESISIPNYNAESWNSENMAKAVLTRVKSELSKAGLVNGDVITDEGIKKAYAGAVHAYEKFFSIKLK